jgi:mannose-6-phosphate isomerase-like protein (cupin superfamily)
MSDTVPGNRTATIIPPGKGASYWVVGDLTTFKLGPEQTDGAYAFAEVTVAPGGGPPPHVHRREDELFYVLDGEFAFVFGDHLLHGTPGFCVHLPKGIPHTFKNVGSRPGRLLVAAMPCGFESFIPTAGTPCADPAGPCPPVTQADVDRLLAACPPYGVEMLFDHKATTPAPERAPDPQFWVLGEHVRLKLTSADTAGQSSVAEVTSPAGGGVPPHAHRDMDEVFYVLEGAYDFTLAGRTTTAWPGTLIHVPKGVFHGFRNAGPRPARLLDYHTPGGFERFFEEAGVPCTDPTTPPPAGAEPPDVQTLIAICHRHGMDLPGPA